MRPGATVPLYSEADRDSDSDSDGVVQVDSESKLSNPTARLTVDSDSDGVPADRDFPALRVAGLGGCQAVPGCLGWCSLKVPGPLTQARRGLTLNRDSDGGIPGTRG
jgi:hypothetical protein